MNRENLFSFNKFRTFTLSNIFHRFLATVISCRMTKRRRMFFILIRET